MDVFKILYSIILIPYIRQISEQSFLMIQGGIDFHPTGLLRKHNGLRNSSFKQILFILFIKKDIHNGTLETDPSIKHVENNIVFLACKVLILINSPLLLKQICASPFGERAQ